MLFYPETGYLKGWWGIFRFFRRVSDESGFVVIPLLVHGLTEEKKLDKIGTSGEVRPKNDKTKPNPAIWRGFFMGKKDDEVA